MLKVRHKLAAAAVALLVPATGRALLPMIPAFAHHGWSSFDTRFAYYASGEVTYVRWGNPHREVHLRVDSTELPSGFTERDLPPGAGADQSDGAATLASARPYDRDHEEIHLVLANPEWMERWGLARPIEVGERLEVVGYMDGENGDELRPVMFWLEDGQGVWQQLTAFPSEPEPAPAQ